MPHSTPQPGEGKDSTSSEFQYLLFLFLFSLVVNNPLTQETDGSRRQSQLSSIAKAAIMTSLSTSSSLTAANLDQESNANEDSERKTLPHNALLPPPTTSLGRALQGMLNGQTSNESNSVASSSNSVRSAPSTAPGSPRM